MSGARALRSWAVAVATATSPLTAWVTVTREPTRVPDDPDITVVLSTLGRCELLRPVLDQLRKQTVPARQVVVANQNEPARRDTAVYDEFDSLGLEIVFQDERDRRTFASLDGFRHRDRASPPSMVCFTKRYHSPRQVREDLLIRLTESIVPYELKRRATTLQWLRF